MPPTVAPTMIDVEVMFDFELSEEGDNEDWVEFWFVEEDTLEGAWPVIVGSPAVDAPVPVLLLFRSNYSIRSLTLL
jgi:hypothetical protein